MQVQWWFHIHLRGSGFEPQSSSSKMLPTTSEKMRKRLYVGLECWLASPLQDKEKKLMLTYNKELLMAFVYFDQSHCGYLMERDLEEIMYTLGLHLSRAQVRSITHSTRTDTQVPVYIFFL